MKRQSAWSRRIGYSWTERARDRYGDHGLRILLLTPTWFYLAFHSQFAPASTLEGTLMDLAPHWLRSVAWAVTAVMAVRWARRPSTHHKAITVLLVMPTLRLMSYLVQAFAGFVELAYETDVAWAKLPWGWWGLTYSIVMYSAIVALTISVASIQDGDGACRGDN